MPGDTKGQILSIINRRLGVLLPAVVLSILVLWIMHAQDYPALAYGEVLLILETLMYLVLAVWSALNAIFLGIVVFGLLFAFLLPVLIVMRELRKKRNPPSDASSQVPDMSKYSTDKRDERNGAYDPVTKESLPQPHQVKDKANEHQREQQGAEVTADFIPGTEPVLPEGLSENPKGCSTT